jgi:CubicO group peptidase (beta-lactamase class C family)
VSDARHELDRGPVSLVGRRRLLAPVALLSALFTGGCAASPSAPATPPPQRFAAATEIPRFADAERVEKLGAALPGISGLVRRTAEAEKLPAVAFGVVIDGKLALVETVGVKDTTLGGAVDAHTRFGVGSVTKTMTAMAALRLRDEGKLDLDRPAANHLPELAGVVYPSRDARPITVRDILMHTSGLSRLGTFAPASTTRGVTEAEMLASLDGLGLESAPGARVSYSNLGYSLLGVMIARASGKHFRDYMRDAVFQPLGMTDAAWQESDVPPAQLAHPHERKGRGAVPSRPWLLGASEAAAGAYMSLSDLGRYVAYQLDAWPARDDADRGPLRRSTVRESHMAVGGAMQLGGRAFSSSVPGLGWQVSEGCDFEHVVFHNGAIGGYTASIHLLPQRGVGLIALTNVAGADLEALNRAAIAMLDDTGALAARVTPPSPALLHAADSVLAGLETGSVSSFADELRPGWVDGRALDRTLSVAHDRLGACRLRGVPETDSPYSARFGLSCESGSTVLRLRVDSAATARITAVELGQPTKGTEVIGAPSTARCR